MQKAPDNYVPDQAVIEAEIRRIDAAIDNFACEMKKAMARKAQEGRTGWADPKNEGETISSLIAHALVAERQAGHEAHIGNFAMMLWVQRGTQQQLAAA
ncbi:hypothetical protein [Burkholderia gladioli]|uniref:hypothetical protein n=1 Tax=Burkholderia gladioli TaxID=28095 RepID=UPI0002D47BCD|nr:hypothetical protein [Burkholderia gladioli]